MKLSRLTFALSSIGLFSITTGVLAQVTTTQEEEKKVEKVQKVEVTGSKIKRINYETASPVQVISRDEIVAMMFLLLFAGHETTTHLISGSVHELLKNPDLRDWLEQDWSRLDLAVEEFLRFLTPVQFTKPRYVRRDIELDGVRLRRGDKVMAMLAAANMDPLANADPERLDLQRRPNRHIAFGTGIHFCLGHQLARIEAKCALKSLFQRWPGLRLAVDESAIRWRRRPGLNALERLPVQPGSP